MKVLLFVLFLYFSFCSYGQNNLVGIKGGISLTNISADPDFISAWYPGNQAGFYGGFTYEHIFKGRFQIGADLIFEQRGFTIDFIYGSNLNSPVKTYFNYNYLTIPLKAGFNFGKKINGFVNIGICPSYLLNSSIIDSTEYSDETEYVFRYDLGALIETGISFKISNRFIVFGSLTYQRSFTTFCTPDYYYNEDFRHLGLIFSVGLKYSFINKTIHGSD